MIDVFCFVAAQVVTTNGAQKYLDRNAQQMDSFAKRMYGRKVIVEKSDIERRMDNMQRQIDFNTYTNMSNSMTHR